MGNDRIDTSKPFQRFEVEVQQHVGRSLVVRGEVEEVRVGRGRREIVAVGRLRDAYNVIEFRNRGAESFRATLPLIFDQIDNRGLLPLRYRVMVDGRWSRWEPIEGYPKNPVLKDRLAERAS